MGRRSRKRLRPHQYPPLVLIEGRIWHLVFVSKLKNGDLGMCDCNGRLILISLKQDLEEMEMTVFHELMHAWEFSTGMKLGHPKIRSLENFICNILDQLSPRRKIREVD